MKIFIYFHIVCGNNKCPVSNLEACALCSFRPLAYARFTQTHSHAPVLLENRHPQNIITTMFLFLVKPNAGDRSSAMVLKNNRRGYPP